MFAPEGYVSLYEIVHWGFNNLYEDAESYLRETIKHPAMLALNRRDDVILKCIKELVSNDLHICQPTGKVLKISSNWLFLNPLTVDIHAHALWESPETSYLSFYSEDVRAGFNLCAPISPKFWDDFNELLSANRPDEEIYEYLEGAIVSDGFTRPSKYFNLMTGCIDFRFVREYINHPASKLQVMWADEDIPEMNAEMEVLSQFEGWSPCVPLDNFGDQWPERCAKVISDMRTCYSEMRNPGGRVYGDNVIDCLLQAYPDGKNESWPKVMERTGYDRRTINRALERNNMILWRSDAAAWSNPKGE